jgi:hypothetical protein
VVGLSAGKKISKGPMRYVYTISPVEMVCGLRPQSGDG